MHILTYYSQGVAIAEKIEDQKKGAAIIVL